VTFRIACDLIDGCPVCTKRAFRRLAVVSDYLTGLGGGWEYVRCSDVACGHVWLHNRPSVSEIKRIYSGYYTEASEPARGSLSQSARHWLWPTPVSAGREAKRAKDPLLGALGPAGLVLEVGAGSGLEASRLRSRGHRVIAQDINDHLTGPDDFTGTLDELPMTGEFDALYSSHSIEHIADVVAEVRQWRRLVRPGGALVVRTPNIESFSRHLARSRWRGFEPPRHFQLFSAMSLGRHRSGTRGRSDGDVAARQRDGRFRLTGSAYRGGTTGRGCGRPCLAVPVLGANR
jgi:SAM-dependent methyltransferase